MPLSLPKLKKISYIPLSTALEAHETYDRVLVRDHMLDKAELKGIIFIESKFERGRLLFCNMSDSHFRECLFQNADLSNSRLHKSRFEKTFLNGCRLTGTQFHEASFQHVSFDETNLSYSQFRFAKLQKNVFEQCDLTDADFYHAVLDGVIFDKCDLSRLDFSQTIFKDVDFRGSVVEGLKIDISQLKNCILEPHQLTLLVSQMGVKLKYYGEE